jgi:putative SOS response-associated peptidase YedK
MCGRFTLKTPPAEWGQLLLPQLDVSNVVADWQPRYNVAPTQSIVGVVHGSNNALMANRFRWGLVPFWADDLSIGNRMINARLETLPEKPAFRGPLANHRCAIVADGYYEWQVQGKTKQPFWIHRGDQQVFAFAGLWERNRKATDQEVLSATIITANASDALASIHNRMPAILVAAALEKWLDPATSAADALELLTASRVTELEASHVSTHVNNPRNEDAACLQTS